MEASEGPGTLRITCPAGQFHFKQFHAILEGHCVCEFLHGVIGQARHCIKGTLQMGVAQGTKFRILKLQHNFDNHLPNLCFGFVSGQPGPAASAATVSPVASIGPAVSSSSTGLVEGGGLRASATAPTTAMINRAAVASNGKRYVV